MAERKICDTKSFDEFAPIYREIAEKAGLTGAYLDEGLTALLYGVYAELLDGSRRMNLTAITECAAVCERHLVDSLIPVSMLDADGLLKDGTRLLDIGAGAGFPTLPIAAAVSAGVLPQIRIHSLDSTAKKISHILSCAEKLGLRCVGGTAGRAEELAVGGKLREKFEVVTARAVSAMPVLIELAAPFVKVGGVFAAMKAHSDEEVAAAARGAEILGFAPAEVREYALPSGDVRSLVIYKKVRSTPIQYPRQYSRIVSAPL